MARAFPASTFVGFDYHEPSVRRARELAAEAGLGNVTFEVAPAKAYPGTGYDLVAFFDCLHDMGIRWARPATSSARSAPMGPACWSSRSPAIVSKRT